MAAKRFTFTVYLDDAIPEEVDLAQEIESLTGNRSRTAWARRMLLRGMGESGDPHHPNPKSSRSSRKAAPRRAPRRATKASAKAHVESAISAVAALPSGRSPVFHGQPPDGASPPLTVHEGAPQTGTPVAAAPHPASHPAPQSAPEQASSQPATPFATSSGPQPRPQTGLQTGATPESSHPSTRFDPVPESPSQEISVTEQSKGPHRYDSLFS
jgi:hypothetical protein